MADHTTDMRREWDQSIKSNENPGEVPGVTLARSIPARTNGPNKRSSSPTPIRIPHIGALGSLALRARPAAK